MDWRIRPIAARDMAPASELKRTLNATQLVLLGLASIVGTGIFILTAEAAQRAGPGMILSFALAATVCGAAALCYAELASVSPVAGGGYTYAYITVGELGAWLAAWALLAEYMLATSAIAVGWSGYVIGLMERIASQPGFAWLDLPDALTSGLFAGGLINLPAALIVAVITGLLIIGTRVGIGFAIALLAAKLFALGLFVALAAPALDLANFEPFLPLGVSGVGAAAASIFFAYLGYDTVAAAGEETRNPQRALPIGILGSLGLATLFYMIVAATAVGAVGARPVLGADGEPLAPGSEQFLAACVAFGDRPPLACSNEALASVLDAIGHERAASVLGVIVFLALPSAIVSTLFALSRLFYALSRDGLLPSGFAKVSRRFGTPARMILLAGGISLVTSSLFSVGRLADVANAGTLFVFFMTSTGLLILRRREPSLVRPFRLPLAWLLAPLAMAGCAFLFIRLPPTTLWAFGIWLAVGVLTYLAYGRSRSQLVRRGANK
ncbi:amino acid transporter [alpha proteobacterium U9-1i]|nr:amino acid transporter [alpha proteobacterium U9-1i]